MKKLLLFLLLLPASLYGANATKDAASSQTSGASTSNSLTWNHTLGNGTERYVIVGVNLQTGGATSATATFNGTTMAPLANVTHASTLRTQMFGLAISDATTSGSKPIIVGANNLVPMAAAAMSFFGVYQAVPTGAPVTATGGPPPFTSGTLVNVTVSGNTEDLIVDVAGINNSAVQPVTCNQTLGVLAFGTHANGPQNVGIGISTKTSGVNTVMSWSKGEDNWISIGVAVKGSSASNPPGGGTPNTGYFFKQNNSWVQKIPVNPALSADSAIISARVGRRQYTLSNSVWSNVICRAQVGDPTYNWDVETTNPARLSFMAAEGSRTNIPMPAGCKPATNDPAGDNTYDKHLSIISADGNTAWDFSHACTPTSTPACNPPKAAFIKKWDLANDLGIGPTDTFPNHCPRAGGVSTLHGLITYEEIHTAGVINHALSFVHGVLPSGQATCGPATDGTCSREVYPAKTADGGNCQNDPNTPTSGSLDCPNFGQRFQLNPSININGLGLNWKDLIVAKAMQDYGFIFVEVTDPNTSGFYAEDLEHSTTKHWNDAGVGGSAVASGATMSLIPYSQIRLIEPITPPFQGSTPSGTITVVSPISGLLFYPGQTLSIGWIQTGVTGNVNIYISYNSGSTYQTTPIVSAVPASTPNATWVVTAPTGTGMRVKVVSVADGAVFGESGIFTIGGQATGLKK